MTRIATTCLLTLLTAALLPGQARAQASPECEAGTLTSRAPADASRYFIALAGRSGAFYDKSGPAFPMLIKSTRGHGHVDAVGIYAEGKRAVFGTVPVEAYRDFMKDGSRTSDVLLRLEITRSQYDRGLKILRTWERRAREGALLYPDIMMDNILLVKQVTESLAACGEQVAIYALDWGLEDDISEANAPSHVPFKFFQEMKRLNQSRHIPDDGFPVRHF